MGGVDGAGGGGDDNGDGNDHGGDGLDGDRGGDMIVAVMVMMVVAGGL